MAGDIGVVEDVLQRITEDVDAESPVIVNVANVSKYINVRSSTVYIYNSAQTPT